MIDLAPPLLILPSHYEARTPAIIRLEPDPEQHFPQLRSTGPDKAMLPGMIPIIAGPRPVSGAYITNAVSSSNLASYTFSGLSIGSASADRLVVVIAAGLKSLVAVTSTSCTIGGVAATSIVATAAPGGSGIALGMYQLLVPTGTTANVVVGFSTTMDRGCVAVYTLSSYLSAVPIGTSKNEGTANPSTSIQVATQGGFTIAGGYNINNGNITWAGGLTENFDVAVEASDQFSGASLANVNGTSFSLSITGAGTVNNHVAATWR